MTALPASVRSCPPAAAQHVASDSAGGLDLFALAESVASSLAGAVLIEDEDGNLLAHCTSNLPVDQAHLDTVLARKSPPYWTDHLHATGILSRLWNTDDAVRVAPLKPGGLPRLAIAIRHEGHVLGLLWVLQAHPGIDSFQMVALRAAAETASHQLFLARSAGQIDRWARAKLRETVLGDGSLPEHAARQLDIRTDAPCAVVALRLQGDIALIEDGRRRLVHRIALHCRAYRRPITAMASGPDDYLVLSSLSSEDPVTPVVEDLVHDAVGSERGRLFVGAGSTVPTTAEVGRSRQEADQVVGILATQSAPERSGVSLAHIDQVRVQIALAAVQAFLETRPDLRLPELDLLPADPKFADTLRCYLGTSGDIVSAARSLGLHANTFRYRIKRIQQLTGLDLSDADTRLALGLMIR